MSTYLVVLQFLHPIKRTQHGVLKVVEVGHGDGLRGESSRISRHVTCLICDQLTMESQYESEIFTCPRVHQSNPFSSVHKANSKMSLHKEAGKSHVVSSATKGTYRWSKAPSHLS